MNHSLGNKATKGAIWATIDRFSYMSIQFAVNIILARLLLPADFGIIGMLAIFITVSQTLIDGGFSSALIQKKAPTQTDYSTIFYWNLCFSTALYFLLFTFAPIISRFFKMPLLIDVLRVIALTLIISGILSIQRTRLQKELAFKKLAIINLSAYALGACCGVILAYSGYGVWSLVWMQLIYGICGVLMMWIVTRWYPSIVFSKSSFKQLFGFGGFIMAANILQTICQNVQGVIIGKRFSATQMGYFSQAYKLDQISSYTIPQVIVQVMYPVYSSLQEDLKSLNNMVLMNMRVIAFLIFPVLSVLIIMAEPLISFLYGNKWIPCVPYFKILCVGGFFVSMQNLNFYAVAAVGKSKSLFKWSFYKWGVLLAALLVGMNFGMYGILWGMVLSSFNIFITNAFLAQRFTGLKLSMQLYSIVPLMLVTLTSILIGYCVNYYLKIPFFSSVITIASYILQSKLFRLQAMKDTIKLAQKILFSKKIN